MPDSRIYGQYTRFSSQIHTHTAKNITNEVVETNISNMNSRSQLLQTGQYQVISLTISYSSGGISVHCLWYQVLQRSQVTQSNALLVSQAGQIVSLTLSSVSDRDGGGDGDGEGNGLLPLFLGLC